MLIRKMKNDKCHVGPTPTGHFHFIDYGLTNKVRSCMSYSHADGICHLVVLYGEML